MNALYSVAKTRDEGLPFNQSLVDVGHITLDPGRWLIELNLRNDFGRTNAYVLVETDGMEIISGFNPAPALSGISRAIVRCDSNSVLRIKAANRSSDVTTVTTTIIAIPVEESK